MLTRVDNNDEQNQTARSEAVNGFIEALGPATHLIQGLRRILIQIPRGKFSRQNYKK